LCRRLRIKRRAAAAAAAAAAGGVKAKDAAFVVDVPEAIYQPPSSINRRYSVNNSPETVRQLPILYSVYT